MPLKTDCRPLILDNIATTPAKASKHTEIPPAATANCNQLCFAAMPKETPITPIAAIKGINIFLMDEKFLVGLILDIAFITGIRESIHAAIPAPAAANCCHGFLAAIAKAIPINANF